MKNRTFFISPGALLCAAAFLLVLFSAGQSFSDVPRNISYQGYLTDSTGTVVPDDTYAITFSIYTGGGSLLWSETHTAVEVSSGVFNVHLGQDPFGNPFPEFDGEMYLGVKVGTDPEMTPRQKFTSVPFALKAADSQLLSGNEASDFSYSDHGHDFSELTGAAEDSQIPDTITVNNADHALTAESAVNADHANTADSATNADHATDADNAVHADSADSAKNADHSDTALNAKTADDADMVDGHHAAAFSSAGHAHHSLDAADGSPTDSVYVDSAGKVGINTTVPARTFDVSGTARVTNSYGTIDMNRHTLISYPFSLSYRYGVRSEVDNSNTYNYGLFGSANSGSLGNYGVYGTTSADNGVGSYGIAGSTGDVTTHGGYFRSYSQKGIGVKGEATYNGDATTAESYGGYFTSSSRRGTGVFAKVDNSGSGLKYAGYFECDSETGYGVYSKVNGDYTSWAVRGEATGSGSGGGWFSTTGENETAVYGYSGSSTGSYNTNKGGRFVAFGNHGYGVHASAYGQYGTGIVASGGSDGYAAEFQGNVKITRQSDGATVMELGEGLDYAEGFTVKRPKMILPGTVLIIDPETPGRLRISDSPYDTRVAGIVAGANGVGSGVRLGADRFDHDVALAGRVYCNVDATNTPIEAGDLLTTSGSPGYAMKACDHDLAQGAILGKAMQKLERGNKGKILVLVTLQ